MSSGYRAYSKRLRGKKILVTGGAGFIGSWLSRYLLGLGSKVFVVDNLATGSLENIKDIEKKIEFHKIDIRDKKKLKKIFTKFDYISHQAALRSVPKSMEGPQEYIEVNIKGTLNLLELAKRFKVKVFVNASSSSVYGETRIFPQREKNPCFPVSFYAMTKLSAEYICNIYYKFFNLPTVSLRYFNVYGPYQSLESQYAMVIPKFITCFLKGKSCPIYGDGYQSRDFTYIEDVVESNILAFIREEIWGEVFNIGGGKSIRVLDIYDNLRIISKKDVGVKFLPPRKGDVRRTQASLVMAERLLNFRPRVNFKDGLYRTFLWFKENRWFWDR